MLYVCAYSFVQLDKRRVEKEFTAYFTRKATMGYQNLTLCFAPELGPEKNLKHFWFLGYVLVFLGFQFF